MNGRVALWVGIWDFSAKMKVRVLEVNAIDRKRDEGWREEEILQEE